MKSTRRDTVFFWEVGPLHREAELVCFGGPFCGEPRTVHPKACMNSLVVLWSDDGVVSETYEVVWMMDTYGARGCILKWHPQ